MCIRDSLKVMSGAGDYVFVDISELKPEFVGEVPVGVHGRVRHVFMKMMVQ